MALKPVFSSILNSSISRCDRDLYHHISEKRFEVDKLPNLSGLQIVKNWGLVIFQLSLEHCGLKTSEKYPDYMAYASLVLYASHFAMKYIFQCNS